MMHQQKDGRGESGQRRDACANAPPPRSRASLPVNQTVAAPATARKKAQTDERFAENVGARSRRMNPISGG